MSSIISKLGSYQILTNLLPGAFFVLTLRFIFQIDIPNEGIFEVIIIYYFIGLVINRVGSLVVEPFLKKLHVKKHYFIKYAPYSNYVKAMRVDPKIDTLSEMNNYIRSLLAHVNLT